MVKNTHLLNGHMLLVHIGIASMRQFKCVPIAYVIKIKDIYFEKYTYHESCPLALPLLNISNCQSVLKYLSLYGKLLYLHDSYITKFYFISKLLFARL